jgi:lipopolysaccharide transport system permease protein
MDTLRELYSYRALVQALIVRHLSTRYRGSVLGFLWSLLNPLCLMVVYTVVFRYYMRTTQVEHYSLFLFAGLLPWIWATSALSEGTSSIVSSGHLITKSMFPAHILPLIAVLTTGVNFLLSLPLMVLFLLISGVPLHSSWVMLLTLIPLQIFFLYGLCLCLSSLNVLYRDVQHLVSNALTLLFFLCPVVYPLSVVPEAWRFTIELNPFAAFTLAYQAVLLEGNFPSLWMTSYLALWSVTSFLVGNWIFRSHHESFAEML